MSKVKHETPEFYMVWTKKGRIPRMAHHTRAKAEAEAERLALLNPGKKFIVLQAVNKISVAGDGGTRVITEQQQAA